MISREYRGQIAYLTRYDDKHDFGFRTHTKRQFNGIFYCFLIFLFRSGEFLSSRFCFFFSGQFSAASHAISIDFFTHLSSNLVAALTSLNMNDFTHFELSVLTRKI